MIGTHFPKNPFFFGFSTGAGVITTTGSLRQPQKRKKGEKGGKKKTWEKKSSKLPSYKFLGGGKPAGLGKPGNPWLEVTPIDLPVFPNDDLPPITVTESRPSIKIPLVIGGGGVEREVDGDARVEFLTVETLGKMETLELSPGVLLWVIELETSRELELFE